jgi:hypothetical protein
MSAVAPAHAIAALAAALLAYRHPGVLAAVLAAALR